MAAPPPIHICVRQTLDWSDLETVERHLIPSFRPRYDLWNETFTIPYHAFRSRLKAIAQANNALVRGARHATFDAIPEGDLVIPVDDDDWFAPDLAERLEKAWDSAADRYLWERQLIEPASLLLRLRRRIARWRGRPTKNTCKTNNYALIKRDGVAPLVERHTVASSDFDANRAATRRIQKTLAVQIRNPSSQSALWMVKKGDREHLIRIVERHRAVYIRPKASREAAWAQPCLDAVAALMKELRVK